MKLLFLPVVLAAALPETNGDGTATPLPEINNIFSGIRAAVGSSHNLFDWDSQFVSSEAMPPSAFVRPGPFVRQLAKGLGNMAHAELNRRGVTVEDKKKGSYFGFIPPLAARSIPGQGVESWTGRCFRNCSVSAGPVTNGIASLSFSFAHKALLDELCSEVLLLGTVSAFQLKSFTLPGKHTVKWKVPANATAAEYWDLANKGVRVFGFMKDEVALLADLAITGDMFIAEAVRGVPASVASNNLKFMSLYTDNVMTRRRDNVSSSVLDVPESLIHPGDFFGVIRLDGLDPMLAWAMGSSTGHTAVALEIAGRIHIAESTTKDSYWPTNGIQATPYKLWMQQALAAGYNTVWAPLSPEKRAQFDNDAAVKQFWDLHGLDYGYENMFTGWIDLVKDNYPCTYPDFKSQCLEYSHWEIVWGNVDKLVPSLGWQMVGQSWARRLNVWQPQRVPLPELLQTAAAQNISAEVLSTMVEKDDYLYAMPRYVGEANQTTVTDGRAMVCCVFVCNTWKAGGLFAGIQDDVNCAELGNFDAYTLNVLDPKPQRPQICKDADPDNDLCQITGKYTLNLKHLGATEPYKHMFEKCSSLPPLYKRAAGC